MGFLIDRVTRHRRAARIVATGASVATTAAGVAQFFHDPGSGAATITLGATSTVLSVDGLLSDVKSIREDVTNLSTDQHARRLEQAGYLPSEADDAREARRLDNEMLGASLDYHGDAEEMAFFRRGVSDIVSADGHATPSLFSQPAYLDGQQTGLDLVEDHERKDVHAAVERLAMHPASLENVPTARSESPEAAENDPMTTETDAEAPAPADTSASNIPYEATDDPAADRSGEIVVADETPDALEARAGADSDIDFEPAATNPEDTLIADEPQEPAGPARGIGDFEPATDVTGHQTAFDDDPEAYSGDGNFDAVDEAYSDWETHEAGSDIDAVPEPTPSAPQSELAPAAEHEVEHEV